MKAPRTVCWNGLHDLTLPDSLTPSARCRACSRVSKARYNRSDKGRAATARYRLTHRGPAERKRRYELSSRGRDTRIRYRESALGFITRQIAYVRRHAVAANAALAALI